MPSALTFTPRDWSVPQEVTVVGKNPDPALGGGGYHLAVGPVRSRDPGYDGLLAPVVPMQPVVFELSFPELPEVLFPGFPVLFEPVVVYDGSGRVSFRLEGAPAGMAVDPERGAVSWAPGVDHAGSVAGAELVAGDGLRSVSRSFHFRVAGLVPLDSSRHGLPSVSVPGLSFYGVDPSDLPSRPPGVVRASGFLLVSAPGEGGALLEWPVSEIPRGAWFDRLRFYSHTPWGGWQAVYDGSWDMSQDPPVFSAGIPGPWAVGFFGYGPVSGSLPLESSLSCRLSVDPVPPPSRIFSGARALPPPVGGLPPAREVMSALGSAMDSPHSGSYESRIALFPPEGMDGGVSASEAGDFARPGRERFAYMMGVGPFVCGGGVVRAGESVYFRDPSSGGWVGDGMDSPLLLYPRRLALVVPSWSRFLEVRGRFVLGADEVYRLSGEVPRSELVGFLAGDGAGPAAAGGPPSRVEYWVGAGDFLLRGVFVSLGGGVPGTDFASLEAGVRFSGYGADVSIPVPEVVPWAGSGPGPGPDVLSLACDLALRDELVFRADADTPGRMNYLVDGVRRSLPGECGEGWRPVAVDPGPWNSCFGAPGARGAAVGGAAVPPGLMVGGAAVPPGLMVGDSARRLSGRDSSNNILVYWSGSVGERPADGAACWLFDSSVREWFPGGIRAAGSLFLAPGLSGPAAPGEPAAPELDPPPDPALCDRELRARLEVMDGPFSVGRVNYLVSGVQSGMAGCSGESWAPVAVEFGPLVSCFDVPGGPALEVGGVALPVSLAPGLGAVPGSAARDRMGNMIVYWEGEASGRPSGGGGCWLFASGSWVSGG